MLGCEDRLNTVAPMIWWSTWESAFHDKLKFAIEKLRVVQLCRCLRSFAVFSQLLKLHMLYVYIYIYMYISIVSSLCFFLHRYLNALVSHIHQYSACFSTTSDQGFQLHRLHCCWQTVRSWYCGTEIWWYHRQDGNTKHVAKEFRLSTYQPINWCNGGIFSSSSWTWVASLHFFFTATPEISCARADSSRHVRGNGMVNLLHCDLLSQDLLRMYCHNLSKCWYCLGYMYLWKSRKDVIINRIRYDSIQVLQA